jgi:hypothetical protein
MNEGKLTFVYRYRPQPGRETYVRELGTGICCQHEDPTVALKEFDSIWAGRSPYRLIEEAPPQPRRDDPKPASAAIEHDAIPFTALARRFHPDLCGKRKFTADQVMAIVNELRETTRASK